MSDLDRQGDESESSGRPASSSKPEARQGLTGRAGGYAARWALGIVATVIGGVIVAWLVAQWGIGAPVEPDSVAGTDRATRDGGGRNVGDPVVDSHNDDPRIGTYHGQAQNNGKIGTVTFTIDSVESDTGAAIGRISWGGALIGEGTLRGEITGSTGEFAGYVDAPFGGWDIDLRCDFVGSGGVDCEYDLEPSVSDGRVPQHGVFTASRR